MIGSSLFTLLTKPVKFYTAFLITFTLTFNLPAHASDAIVAAKQAYANKNYEAAVALVAPALSSSQPRDPGDTLTIALIFLRSAETHAALHRTALRTQLDFLTQLRQSRATLHSKFADLYLAEALFESGQADNAKRSLNIFLTYPNLPPREQAIATFLLNSRDKKNTSTMPADEEAAVAWLASHPDKEPQVLIDTLTPLLEKLRTQTPFLSARLLANAITIYRAAHQPAAALALLNQSNKGAPSAVEVFDETRFIRFYDVTLLRTISELYRDLANDLLRQLKTDAKYKDTALFYLSESSLIFSDASYAQDGIATLANLQLLPKSAKPLLEIRLRAHEYMTGQGAKAMKTWAEAATNVTSDPAVSADAIQMCVYLDANCPFIVKAAEEFATRGRSDRFVPLWTSLGQYFLAKGNANKAAELLETARDKTRKVSLEANSPGLLISMAEVLRQQKEYPQALEIYFELARAFPAVRIIQEGLQGSYALANRSPGGVTIF